MDDKKGSRSIDRWHGVGCAGQRKWGMHRTTTETAKEKRKKSQKIMPMHGAMMLKIQETRNVFDERKGKGGEKGNKQKNLSDHGGARGGDAMKKETVSWQRKEKMTQNKHTENQGQSTTPCNSNHAKLSGGAAPQQHSPQPEPTPLLGRREQITKKCLKCTLCHWKKVKLTLLENTASQSVWFQPAIQSLNLWRSAVKSNSFFYLLHEVGKPAKTPSSSLSQVHHHASPPITVHHTLSPCLPMSTVWGMQNLSPSQPNANLIKAKSLALKLPQSNVKPPREACECGGGFLAWARTEPTKTCCSEEKNESRKQRLDDFILWRRCRFWLGSVRPQALARSESPKWGLCHHENCWQSGIHQTAAGRLFQSAPAIE